MQSNIVTITEEGKKKICHRPQREVGFQRRRPHFSFFGRGPDLWKTFPGFLAFRTSSNLEIKILNCLSDCKEKRLSRESWHISGRKIKMLTPDSKSGHFSLESGVSGQAVHMWPFTSQWMWTGLPCLHHPCHFRLSLRLNKYGCGLIVHAIDFCFQVHLVLWIRRLFSEPGFWVDGESHRDESQLLEYDRRHLDLCSKQLYRGVSTKYKIVGIFSGFISTACSFALMINEAVVCPMRITHIEFAKDERTRTTRILDFHARKLLLFSLKVGPLTDMYFIQKGKDRAVLLRRSNELKMNRQHVCKYLRLYWEIPFNLHHC